MLNPICAAFLLAVEARRVIELQLVRIAWGGAQAQPEMAAMVTMVSQKILAALEATTTLMTGGTHDQLVARDRELVADNTRRLLAA